MISRRVLAVVVAPPAAVLVLTVQAAPAPHAVDWERVATLLSIFIGIGGASLAAWALRTLSVERHRAVQRHPDVQRDLADIIGQVVMSEAVVRQLADRICERLDASHAKRIAAMESHFGRLEASFEDLIGLTDKLLGLKDLRERRAADHGPPPPLGERRQSGPVRRASGPVDLGGGYADPPHSEGN